MMRKKGHIQKIGNLYVFPGTVQKILAEAADSFEKGYFHDAVEKYEQAMPLTTLTEEEFFIYAFALFEIKSFQLCLEVTEELLMIYRDDPTLYYEVMELYLSSLIQLRRYEETHQQLEMLFQTGEIPDRKYKKFTYLKQLNERLAHHYQFSTPDDWALEKVDQRAIQQYQRLSFFDKLAHLSTIEAEQQRSQIAWILEVIKIEREPLLQTHLLVLLQQFGWSQPVDLEKFTIKQTVIPKELEELEDRQKAKDVKSRVSQLLEREPQLLETVHVMIDKYMMLAYPLEWQDYTPEEVATAYCHYAESLFNRATFEMDDLYRHIIEIECYETMHENE